MESDSPASIYTSDNHVKTTSVSESNEDVSDTTSETFNSVKMNINNEILAEKSDSVKDTSIESMKENDKHNMIMKRKTATASPVSSKFRVIDSPRLSHNSNGDCSSENGIDSKFNQNGSALVKGSCKIKTRRNSADENFKRDENASNKKFKRSSSIDLTLEVNDKSKLNSFKFKRPSLIDEKADCGSERVYLSPTREDLSNPSVNNSPGIIDSQDIVLTFLPCSESIESKELLPISETSNEDQHSSQKEENNMTAEKKSSSDLDTTTSVNMDSPINNEIPDNPCLKNKPYLKVGCSSSTPENIQLEQEKNLFKTLKNINISDNDSDYTPPFKDFNKLKSSNPSKLNSSTNRNESLISPLSNGHSYESSVTNTSNLNGPTFDVQIHCDENQDFLSFLVVKTDNETGVDISKEYQKMHKRVCRDYTADVSKSNSHSSVTSGGLLQLPTVKGTSFLSSSSSASSIRTSDDAFAVPQRPDLNPYFQHFISIKGLKALRQKVDDIINRLVEIYGVDNTSQYSLQTSMKSPGHSFGSDKKINSNEKSYTESSENNQTVTPKSSKKKIKSKSKRILTKKCKKDILPMTKEETDISNEIHSPEMIITDMNRCQRPSTPLTSNKYPNSYMNNNNNNNMSSPKQNYITNKPINSKMQSPSTKSDINHSAEGTLVLAKWTDKKYYSGQIKEALNHNRYLVEFDDGRTKALLEDFIIFGTTKELPISDKLIYARTEDGMSYEPCLVMSVIYEKNDTILYQCATNGESTLTVKASDIYVTEEQAKVIKENYHIRSPHSTSRRKVNSDLDLDNIIDGPRTTRSRDKCSKTDSSSINSKASTSGLLKRQRKCKESPMPKQRQESESSESSEFTSRAPSTSLEEVSGVQPEIQKTPRKIDGVKADALLIKGASKQNLSRRCSKVNKFQSDLDTNNCLGPIPPKNSNFFKGLHFLLTCTDPPAFISKQKKPISHWSDTESSGTINSSSTEKEDAQFTTTPFHKERLKEQLESAGGIVYSHFENIPKDVYGICKLISPRPCLTAKYIQCLAADIKALSHFWVVRSCLANQAMNMDEDALPAGWSIEKKRFINWQVSPYERENSTPFKNQLILLCSDNETFIKFWRRVCVLAGGDTRTVNEEDLNFDGGLVIVTESDCPHEVQNKAVQDNIPLVSTIWVIQCLIEGRICDHSASIKYNFAYNEMD